jgi:hypothetical protein
MRSPSGLKHIQCVRHLGCRLSEYSCLVENSVLFKEIVDELVERRRWLWKEKFGQRKGI